MLQFNDEFVTARYPGQFSSAEEVKKSLLATTAMERVQLLDQQLGEEVKKVREQEKASHRQQDMCAQVHGANWEADVYGVLARLRTMLEITTHVWF